MPIQKYPQSVNPQKMRQPLSAMAKILLLILFVVLVGVLLAFAIPTPTALLHLYIALTAVYVTDKFIQLA